MEIVWTKDIDDKDFVHFNYECKPLIWNNRFYYAYKTTDRENRNFSGYYGTKISIIETNLNNANSIVRHISFKYKDSSKNEILLTSQWKFLIINDKLFLYVGFLLNLNESQIAIEDRNYKLETSEIKEDYFFKDKNLKYNQLSKIECFEKVTEKKIWKVKIKGFLYTNIELKNNYLFFGTAGKGGAFYCVELDTGNILTEYSNSDSSKFAWQNNSVILRDTKGNLVQINPYSGKVINQLQLKDKLFYAQILIYEDNIYATVYNKKQNIARIICVNNKEKKVRTPNIRL